MNVRQLVLVLVPVRATESFLWPPPGQSLSTRISRPEALVLKLTLRTSLSEMTGKLREGVLQNPGCSESLPVTSMAVDAGWNLAHDRGRTEQRRWPWIGQPEREHK